MKDKDESTLLKLRAEYEQSGMTKAEFARNKGMDYWKVSYALRKALRLKSSESVPSKFKFRKINTNPNVSSSQEIRIKTSYGAEIIIPL